MTLEKVINILGKALDKTLIIKRELITDETFKAYKTYKIELYGMEKKKPVILETIQVTDKIIDTNKEAIITKIEETFLRQIFDKYVHRD